MKIKLYYHDAKGGIRAWSVRSYKNGLTTRSGTLTGDFIEVDHPIPYGLGGRTKKQQKRLKFRSMINKKLDKGYCYTEQEARDYKPTNSLGFLKPMAAFRFDKLTEADLEIMYSGNVYVQRKYNGNRCMVTKHNGELIAYSRGGKVMNNPAILEILKDIDIPEGTTIDGELYCHGHKLQTITSWIKKNHPDSKKIQYIVYDIVIDAPYGKRYTALCKLGLRGRAQVAHTALLKGKFNPIAILINYVKAGYEGVIFRLDSGTYEDGRRPKTIIKLKNLLDDEFLVIKIIASVEGFARLICVAKNGKTFKVFAPGSQEKKKRALGKKENYIGRYVRVEYFEESEDGLPIPPVAKEWRNKCHE